jgi:hypothetical protein
MVNLEPQPDVPPSVRYEAVWDGDRWLVWDHKYALEIDFINREGRLGLNRSLTEAQAREQAAHGNRDAETRART